MEVLFKDGPFDGRCIDSEILEKMGLVPIPFPKTNQGVGTLYVMPEPDAFDQKIGKRKEVSSPLKHAYERVCLPTQIVYQFISWNEMDLELIKNCFGRSLRADIGLSALSQKTQEAVISQMFLLASSHVQRKQLRPLGTKQELFLFPIDDKLRAIVRLLPNNKIELVDLLQQEALDLIHSGKQDLSASK